VAAVRDHRTASSPSRAAAASFTLALDNLAQQTTLEQQQPLASI
jgi:hypothetical protein